MSKKQEGKKDKKTRKTESFERAEECLVLMYTWRRERGEGLGPFWSYAVLCDKVAQVFLSMNFSRGKRWISFMLLVLSSAVFLSIFPLHYTCLFSFKSRWTAADNKSFSLLSSPAQQTDCSSPLSPAETPEGQLEALLMYTQLTHSSWLCMNHLYPHGLLCFSPTSQWKSHNSLDLTWGINGVSDV